MDYMTAGESHGPQLTGILTGVPAGLHLDIDAINQALAARQGGYGRGSRQKIEHDTVQIVGGVRHSITMGGPIALVIQNRDHGHWGEIMSPTAEETPENTLRQVTRPRPGHADLVGGQKYGHHDMRNVLERSSARETAMRVAVGAICKQLLQAVGITIVGYVDQVGSVKGPVVSPLNVAEIEAAITQNDMRMLDDQQVDRIHLLIDETRHAGNTLGGVVRVVANGVPAGLGSYTAWNQKLDAKIAAAVVGVNAIKGVEIGDGFEAAQNLGSEVMDQIDWHEGQGYSRLSDHLGGFEGGMTNGMPIVVRGALKPIPTLYQPLQSVDIHTHEVSKANVERSDTTAIVPASIVVESAVSFELAKVLCDTFDDANLARMQKQVADYRSEFDAF
ncbi:chorismate synthase [Lacticaseibacillus manihotivorans]|jgi:chorismate synthase|uniref:Chorismate synthase n=2 Tax=Lacticaseibacillus manihotivorans TaxID=88233 RepID=A0A0R1QHJ7_9LACO|nr:chorismate synthase [Lacticaseibacillus manihotivorans]KRL44343.1 chorismate synthase [Lacticaseibacillus manihotivorans DSM 13343 = JCM 12514]QFQ91729.1 chorismate synthase [Lacticaseibacillus manihotivorans]